MPPTKRKQQTAPLAKQQKKTTASWSDFACTVELWHNGKVKTSAHNELAPVVESGSVLCSLWHNKPPAWWNKMMREEDLEDLKLRVKFDKLSTAESIGAFVGDVCDGDEDYTSFGPPPQGSSHMQRVPSLLLTTRALPPCLHRTSLAAHKPARGHVDRRAHGNHPEDERRGRRRASDVG